MKKISLLVCTLVLSISLIILGGGFRLDAASAAGKNGKTLVVYFSLPETANPNNMTRDEDNSAVVINGKVLGNTQYVANVIQEHTGADIFRIEPQKSYPLEHKTLVEQARKEIEGNLRPTLKAKVGNIKQYDTIFLGYPIWCADMPMILYSFLEQHDFSGKRIIPFSTHGGSGFAGTPGAIAASLPRASVHRSGLSISRGDVQNSKPDIIAWLKSLNF